MNRFGRLAFACSALASATVLAVSCASSGDTSSDTQPSTPAVRSWIGANSSAACARSSIASSKNSASPDLPAPTRRRISSSYDVAVRDRMVEDRRVRGQPGDRQLVDVALQRAAGQQVAGDVVEPEALAQRRAAVCVAFIASSPPSRLTEQIAQVVVRAGRRYGRLECRRADTCASIFGIERIVALPRENRREPSPQIFFMPSECAACRRSSRNAWRDTAARHRPAPPPCGCRSARGRRTPPTGRNAPPCAAGTPHRRRTG